MLDAQAERLRGSTSAPRSEKQNDPRISELMAIGLDRLIVLERTEQTTKPYEIDLGSADNILGTPWDDPATRPTLEQTQVQAAHIKDVPKTLRFDSADFPEMVGKTEGMALLGDGSLALINDMARLNWPCTTV